MQERKRYQAIVTLVTTNILKELSALEETWICNDPVQQSKRREAFEKKFNGMNNMQDWKEIKKEEVLYLKEEVASSVNELLKSRETETLKPDLLHADTAKFLILTLLIALLW